MSQNFVFVNRRKGDDRRTDRDPCKNLQVDLFHRKRRKSTERRDCARSLSEDYYAYMESNFSSLEKQGEGEQMRN